MLFSFPTVAKTFHHWAVPYQTEGHSLHTGQRNADLRDTVGTAHRQA